MMEKHKNGPKETTMKASNLKINEEENEASSWMIGSIVEKGICDNSQIKPSPPSSFPKPTVLPFPIARHRSHGPHWAPVGSLTLDNDGNGEVGFGDSEDESFTGIDAMAAFAKPMQRKQNKGSDVSRWKKMNQNDTSSLDVEEDDRLSAEFKKQKKYGESKDMGYMDTNLVSNNLSQYPPKENVRSSPNSQVGAKQTSCDEIVKAHVEIMEEIDKALPEMLKIREQKTSKSTTASCSGLSGSGGKLGSMSIESEIDAENRARLQEMSREEIEQAQAEIMDKMDPALVEVLKRRALDKFKKQNKSSLDVTANGNHLDYAIASTSDISSMAPYASTKDTQRRLENDSMQKSGQASSSLWDAWSQRVEAVRHLRFSLDGAVVEYDTIQAHVTGESVARSDYSTDNVAQRDLLRTEGDPGAAGYTIKEATALTRSVIPGQRALALHLLASLLDKALHHIDQNQSGHAMSNVSSVDIKLDWEAIWAFALGPEPDLVLSLRLCLDDNHSSVVLACVKLIHCILSCDINEQFFDILEKTATYEKNVCTAPVFRSRPQIDTGFLHGGLWKYNAKTSNIVLDVVDEKAEEERTIQDDIFLAGQDIAAGLIRMEILPRLCYLLEAEPSLTLEESIISILIAIARHSPTCANAIVKCQRLVQTIVHRFTTIDATKVHSAKIKSVTLLKALAQSDKKTCMELIENGIFQSMMWHLYRPALSISQWIKSGEGHCKVASALMVEQLRLWKVCIKYGYCVSYFADFFPALCLWLNPPTFEKLIENNVFREFTSISMEAYLVLEALARTLPSICSQKVSNEEGLDITGDEIKVWTWSHVTPMIDIALKWIALKSNPGTIQFFEFKEPTKEKTYFLWVISSVMLMLSSVLERVMFEDKSSSNGGNGVVPWLPEFVPKIGLGIIKNGFLSFSEPFVGENSLVESLCNLRCQGEYETSLASVCFLHGLVCVVVSVDDLIYAAKLGPRGQSPHDDSRKGNILEDGILRKSHVEFKRLLTTMMDLVALEWKHVQSIETFGRGGPAPGSGNGWGVFSGGFWSETVLLSQMDSRMLIHLLKIFQIVPNKNALEIEEMPFTIQKIQSALGVCLIVGPRDRVTLEKALDILFQVPTLKFFYFSVCHFMNTNGKLRKFQWDYSNDDYLCFCEILASHFRNRWLCVKKRKAAGSFKLNKGTTKLDTIPEEIDTSNVSGQDCPSSSLSVEWAHQRLPLPMHWFLSPISNIYDISSQSNLKKKSEKSIVIADPTVCLEVTKAGLFFLLGIEAISFFLPKDVQYPVTDVPLIWKLHSLSVVLLNGMSVLEDEKSRDIYETLQDLYGRFLVEKKKDGDLVSEKRHGLEKLRFQSEIHESYSTFIETLVEQFSAISYGDLIFGRQVAIYLLRGVESSIRLAAWNALSSTRVLELLPPLDKCLANAEGYLDPAEDNEEILEAYVKSWVSGALDRAATRGSVSFTLVLHHISSFIFQNHTNDKLLTRNKIVKSLLRDYSRKPIHEGMMLDLIRCNQNTEQNKVSSLDRSEIESRLQSLIEGCEGNSSFLTKVEKLKSLI